MTSSEPSNLSADLARRLQELFERPDPEPAAAPHQPPPAGTAASPAPIPDGDEPAAAVISAERGILEDVRPLLADLHEQLELLCQQLDNAFGEVDQRFAAQERGLLSLASSAAGDQGILRRVETLVERSAATIHELASTIAEGPGAASVGVQDLAARIDTTRTEVIGQLRDHQAAARADLEKLADVLRARWGAPVTVDTRSLEETVGRESIAHAADLANLRSDLAAIAGAVRRQDDKIGEMCEQLAWIKQRLLGR